MGWAPGLRGGLPPPHIASGPERGWGGGPGRPLGVLARAAGTRASGSHFHANSALTTHSAAATSPGTVSPTRAANDPSAGPKITPALVAADSQPSPLARSLGAIVSAT